MFLTSSERASRRDISNRMRYPSKFLNSDIECVARPPITKREPLPIWWLRSSMWFCANPPVEKNKLNAVVVMQMNRLHRIKPFNIKRKIIQFLMVFKCCFNIHVLIIRFYKPKVKSKTVKNNNIVPDSPIY